MTMRTSEAMVTFRHPFKLTAAEDMQPAGRYLVETDEELIQSVSFPAYRRLSTFIHLRGRPDSSELARVVVIDPEELAEALAADAGAGEPAPASSEQSVR
jgi:hypothetical protein